MRLRVVLLAALLAPACSVQPYRSPGELKVDAQDVYYDVHGATAQQISDDLDRQRFPGEGDHWLAETTSDLHADYRFSEAAVGGCRMSRVTVTIVLRTTLPRWDSPPSAPEALRQQWQRFLAAARTHEKGHYDNAVAAANEATDALRGLQTPTCATFPHDANALFQSILARHKAVDAKYDAQTRHGILQGTVWVVERGT